MGSNFDVGNFSPIRPETPTDKEATDPNPTLAPTPPPLAAYDPVKRNELGRVVEGGGTAPVAGAGGAGGGVRVQVVPISGSSSSSDHSDSSEGGRRHLATLNVGDRFASESQNSPTTARAAGPNLPGSASYSVSVPPPSRVETRSVGAPSPTPPQQGSIPLSSHASGTVEYSLREGDDPEAYILRRRRFPIFDPVIVGTPPGPPILEPAAPPSAPPGEAPAETPTARYVLDVHDVNDMGRGSTKSSIDIKNGAGEMVQHVDLPPGDSRVIVDLPPGDYTFTANSGTRSESSPSPVGDNADNFRVDISQAGGSSESAPAPSPS